MKTLLIIDDEAGIAEALAEILSDEGYHVLTAPNGRVGYEMALEEKPALILLDYMMPVEDGSSTLRRLKANPELEKIPVVMMSAVAEANVRAECSGIAAFLRKPFRLNLVLETIARLVAPERAAG
jgi:CheY-like chemotaxis protein